MKLHKLICALLSIGQEDTQCPGCGKDCGCDTCDLTLQLAQMVLQLETLRKSATAEKQAAFRLGQMDMWESVIAMLRVTEKQMLPDGIPRLVIQYIVRMVEDLEVL